MPPHIDTGDPKYRQAAAEILRRHDNGEPEANITSAVRTFLTVTGLVKDEEIAEENPPAEGSGRAVDLTALDTFIEFKRRIGTTGGFDPDPANVRQLDDYLEASQKQGRVRMGILTDGKHWLLRWPNAGPVRTVQPYAFTFDDPDRWVALHDWLRDFALSAEEETRSPPVRPSRSTSAPTARRTSGTSTRSRRSTTSTPASTPSRSSASSGATSSPPPWARSPAPTSSSTTSSSATPI